MQFDSRSRRLGHFVRFDRVIIRVTFVGMAANPGLRPDVRDEVFETEGQNAGSTGS